MGLDVVLHFMYQYTLIRGVTISIWNQKSIEISFQFQSKSKIESLICVCLLVEFGTCPKEKKTTFQKWHSSASQPLYHNWYHIDSFERIIWKCKWQLSRHKIKDLLIWTGLTPTSSDTDEISTPWWLIHTSYPFVAEIEAPGFSSDFSVNRFVAF